MYSLATMFGVRFALGIHAGMNHINDHSVDDTPTGPFGGEKNSGIRFGCEWIIHELAKDQWVSVRHQRARKVKMRCSGSMKRLMQRKNRVIGSAG